MGGAPQGLLGVGMSSDRRGQERMAAAAVSSSKAGSVNRKRSHTQAYTNKLTHTLQDE